jgi:hypothetical protein
MHPTCDRIERPHPMEGKWETMGLDWANCQWLLANTLLGGSLRILVVTSTSFAPPLDKLSELTQEEQDRTLPRAFIPFYRQRVLLHESYFGIIHIVHCETS